MDLNGQVERNTHLPNQTNYIWTTSLEKNVEKQMRRETVPAPRGYTDK